ncbi:protein of unknown function (plasmid) [Streptantibioticus cattleyicolor NRRL 8057 = DSM 46488]|nr:protein of unknown function [Streptantibioticus cattleyicolor NRRL 8057 = DSM 46488]
MELMILHENSEWGQLTHEAGELARRLGLGELQHSLPTKVGVRKKSVRRVYVFRGGVVWQDPDAAEQALRWNDVVDWRESTTHNYRYSTYTHTNFSYTFTGSGQLSLKLASSFRDGRMHQPPIDRFGPPQACVCSEIGREICDYLARTRLPGTLEAVGRGERQTFGSVSLASDGIQVGGTEVPWELVEDLRVDKGWFKVAGAGLRRPPTRAVSDIPRFTLLKAAADALLEKNRDLPRIG